MAVVTYESASFNPSKVVRRYVSRRIHSSFYKVFDVDSDGFTLREIDQVCGVDIPISIANKADDIRNKWPTQVELPKDWTLEGFYP